jgi:hypothetical protein
MFQIPTDANHRIACPIFPMAKNLPANSANERESLEGSLQSCQTASREIGPEAIARGEEE